MSLIRGWLGACEEGFGSLAPQGRAGRMAVDLYQ